MKTSTNIHRYITIQVDAAAQRVLKTDQSHATFDYAWNGRFWKLQRIADSSPPPRFGSRPSTPKWVKKMVSSGMPYRMLHDKIEYSTHCLLDGSMSQTLSKFTGTAPDFPNGVSFIRLINVTENSTTDSVIFDDSADTPHNEWITSDEMDSLAASLGLSFPYVQSVPPALAVL